RDTIVISHGNQAPPFVNETSLGAIQAAIGVWTELLFGPFVLPPGTGVMVSSVTLNNQIAAWFSGRSRQARPEELAPGARRKSPPGGRAPRRPGAVAHALGTLSRSVGDPVRGARPQHPPHLAGA